MIKFKHLAGPFGDETSNYAVSTDAKTVGEFIDFILAGQDNDNYITICLRRGKGIPSDDACVAYILREKDAFVLKRKCRDYETYRKCTIQSIHANGGWGAMSFDIVPNEDFPQQERLDFSMTYWGMNMFSNK